jgi:hypothetical protein
MQAERDEGDGRADRERRVAPLVEGEGIFAIPISAPSQGCFRTAPRKRNPTPMVTMARKSSRTRNAANPTTMPNTPATSTPARIAIGNGRPATEHSAAA